MRVPAAVLGEWGGLWRPDLAGVAFWLMASPAAAQVPADSTSFEVEPIVVTADRAAAPLATSTAAVSVLSAEELRWTRLRSKSVQRDWPPGTPEHYSTPGGSLMLDVNRIARAQLAMVGLLALAPGSAVTQGHHGPSIGLERVAEGLVAPVQLTAPNDGTGHRFVVDQIGVIQILTKDGVLMERPFLDLRDRIVELSRQYDERGLLGLAFHPDYAENGRFFVYYSAPLQPAMSDSFDHANRLSEFRVSRSEPHVAEPGSERILLEMAWPYTNHNGGTIVFGPTDGYLYVALGDGGNRDDQGRGHVPDWYDRNVGGNGQDIEQNLLGSILRIDVDGAGRGEPYAIPSDNPFVGRAGLDEIWAYGLRNPFRIAFDRAGELGLFASDAGQELWEEIDLIVKGGNYGWNVREGTHCFDAANPQHPPFDCPTVAPNGDPLLPPIIEYDHYKGVVSVGGTVYRGEAVPAFQGKYLFADWSSDHNQPRGTLFFAEPPPVAGSMWSWTQLNVEGTADGGIDEYIRSFGEDADGELYVLTSNVQGLTGTTGKVFKIVSGSTQSQGHQH